MRDILSEFGPDADKPQPAVADCGGVKEVKSIPYSTPVGPIGISNRSVGLGGTNLGNAGSQGKHVFRSDGGAGAPGITRLGGENEGKGTQNG